MASPPIPPLLGHLAARPFSFYPPILHVEHNEWIFRKATWSDLVVVNHKSGVEISIPRTFVGEISLIDHPVVIVGLSRELEYKDGAVSPYQRRVIEMPIAVGEGRKQRGAPAPVVAIRLESRRDSRALKLIGGTLTAALLLHLGVASLTQVRQRAVLPKDRSYLDLTGRDDYAAVIRKLGPPAGERRHGGSDGSQFEALSYPWRRFTVVLMGSGTAPATYIGTMDSNWNPIHSAGLMSGGSTSGLLRALKKF
jgi:hypothetical protein